MPKKILASQRRRFWALYHAGHTIVEASKRAGFSESYGKSLIRDGKGEGVNGFGVTAKSVQASTTQTLRDWEEEEESRPREAGALSDVAADCLVDFERFRARYLGSVSTPGQVEAAQKVVTLLDSPQKEYGVMNCPQGWGKTRLAHDIAAWVTARNRAIRAIFGSLSQSVSGNSCANLRDTLERTVPARAREEDVARGLGMDAEATLAQDYGRFKPIASGGLWRRESFIVEQVHGASMEKEPTWAAFSREAKFLGWRVDLMIWDDLVNTDMLRNQDRVDDLYRWWDDEAQSRLDPGGLLLLVGQRLRSNDIYRFCLDKRVVVDEFDTSDDAATRPMYHHIIFKAHYDDRCMGDAGHRADATPYPEGCMLDPRRITWRDIKHKQADGNYEVVYQQEDTDPSHVLVKKEWVNGGRADGVDHDGCWDTNRSVGQLPVLSPGSLTVRYMTVDPSPTKYWGIEDWLYALPNDGTERLAGFRYLVDLLRRSRFGANEFLDWSRDQLAFTGVAEDMVQRSKKQGMPITHLVMEKNAAQRWAMQYSFFTDWARSRGVQVIQHETMSNNKNDPDYGVWATLPNVYRHGRVRLPGATVEDRRHVYPLVQEVTTYPDGRTDDCLMSQWFGEVNLQHLVAAVGPVGTIYTDIPSWVQGGAPNARVQHIREVTGAVR